MNRAAVIVLLIGAGVAVAVAWITLSVSDDPEPHAWSAGELRAIGSLSLSALPPLPPDPSNAVADDPRAVKLGHRLYFDARFSVNGEISCATCHKPELKFTDGLPLGEAVGTTRRHTPSIVGTAYNAWFFWDGRRDSQWGQAITPMEDPVEHAGTRTQYAHLVARHYRAAFEELFGPLPDLSDARRFPASAGPFGSADERAAWEAMSDAGRLAVDKIFAGVGKAIAAYERRILHGPSRFDRYAGVAVAGDDAAMRDAFDDEEAEGLRLFIGKANCIECHNGPRFTNNGFHNIGLPPVPGEPYDTGRIEGARQALDDAFNCLSPHSDAAPEDCDELRFIKTEGLELDGAMKVPSLRNVADTAPYMERGQLATLAEVLRHYDLAPEPLIGHSDLEPLQLSDRELASLEAFLRTLSGPIDAPPELLTPPAP
jgi:cytochrome c peroxidase